MSSAQAIILDADLHAYVDGQLTRIGSELVQSHLQGDPVAAARAARWMAESEALRARLAAVAEEPLPLRLKIARMKAAADREERGKLLFTMGFVGGFVAGMAVAAMLLTRAG